MVDDPERIEFRRIIDPGEIRVRPLVHLNLNRNLGERGEIASTRLHIPNASAPPLPHCLCASAFSPRVENTTAGTVVFDAEGWSGCSAATRIGRKFSNKCANTVSINVAIASNADAAICAARGFSGITVLIAELRAACAIFLSPCFGLPPKFLKRSNAGAFAHSATLRNFRGVGCPAPRQQGVNS
jgi:hypothetical protein